MQVIKKSVTFYIINDIYKYIMFVQFMDIVANFSHAVSIAGVWCCKYRGKCLKLFLIIKMMWYFWVTKYNPKTEKWKTTWKYELNPIQRQINEKRLWKYGLNIIQRKRNEIGLKNTSRLHRNNKNYDEKVCVKDEETRTASWN